MVAQIKRNIQRFLARQDQHFPATLASPWPAEPQKYIVHYQDSAATSGCRHGETGESKKLQASQWQWEGHTFDLLRSHRPVQQDAHVSDAYARSRDAHPTAHSLAPLLALSLVSWLTAHQAQRYTGGDRPDHVAVAHRAQIRRLPDLSAQTTHQQAVSVHLPDAA